MSNLKGYILATRPWSFTMSVLSVSVGTLIAAEAGPISWPWFALTLIGIVCFHAAANTFNDYFDTQYKVDQADSPTAKYRPQPILSGLMTPRQVLIEALWLFGLTIAVGMAISFERSRHVLWIGIIGALTSYFYTAGPIKFKYRGMGEFAVFLMWGPLMVEGAYAVQCNALSFKALCVSFPIGILVALVILANNMRDRDYDARHQIKTVSILLGEKGSYLLFAGLIIIAYLCVLAMVVLHIMSLWGLLIMLSLPKAVVLLRRFKQSIPDAADALTAQFNTVFGILLILSMLLESRVVL